MINVLFCGNEKVFDGALTELISITNKTKEAIRCYIFTMDISRIKPEYTCIKDEQIDFLNKVVKSKNAENEVIKIDVTDLYEKEFNNCKNETAYCTPYTLLRLLADLVPNMPDKLLYLDIDMMVADDIAKLYNTDITEYEYAAVKEKYGSILLYPDYINAGMLLLNMKEIRRTKLLEKARDLIRDKKMLFADQDAIYKATTKKLLLPRIYNEQSKFNKKDTVICHFCKRLLIWPYPRTENYKQWNVEEVHKILKCHAFDADLEEYQKWKVEYDIEMKGEKLMHNGLEVIPIFFALDDEYTPFLAVAMQSLVKNASKKYYYLIKILYTNISSENQKKLEKYESENINIEFVDLNYYIAEIKDKLYTRDYYTQTTYFRLFIPELYPQYNKALYLDSDITILSDIADLYNIEMGNNLVAAAPDGAVQNIGIFQEYVEKVVGVANYKHYFNAGVLLMNLDELRKFKFQEKFVHLLETMKFPVAQDQDYLNRLCKGRVKIIPNTWNRMPLERDDVKRDDIHLIHYNLADKPWHFEEVLYQEYFWEYAKKTEFYDKIQEIKNNYTEEQRFMDRDTGKKLLELAQKESDCVGDDREERKISEIMQRVKEKYKMSNKVENPVVKSQSREEVLEKIKNLEENGIFDVDVEDDPPTIPLTPDNVDYLREKGSNKVKNVVANMVGKRYLNELLKDNKLIIKDIKGMENLQDVKSGAIITCNHFNPFDSFAIEQTFLLSGESKTKKLYKVIREGNYTNFPGLPGFFFRNCDTLPLSSNKRTMIEFMKAVEVILQRGDFILMYPEQSMWWNYRKPKPLKNGAFKLAAKNNVPIIPIFITMEDSDIVGEDGFMVQQYIINIEKPIYPDENLAVRENMENMKEKNSMVWKDVYEEFYKIPLEYTTKKEEAICRGD